MNWPVPRPGLVIRYSYLWESEARQGREEGVKDRPCAIVLVVLREGEHPIVRVLPVTHTVPDNPADALEIPAETKVRLGLDAERSWVVLTEANDFIWPGPDLRPLPGRDPSTGIPAAGFHACTTESIGAALAGTTAIDRSKDRVVSPGEESPTRRRPLMRASPPSPCGGGISLPRQGLHAAPPCEWRAAVYTRVDNFAAGV